jgi:hypothetical protein
MTLSNPRGQFGVHSVCFYDIDTGLPLAYLRVLGECIVDFSGELIDLMGGSNQYLWDTEIGSINSEIALTGREYDGNTMEILTGGNLTENPSESTGSVEEIANVNGTSVINASTGLVRVSVTSGDSADLKTGKYIFKATAADTGELYCCSDVDFQSGTDAVFDNDDLKVADLDFSSGLDQVVADFGLTFEVGSGSLAFTINDTAEFYVRKPNTSSLELVFGQSGAEFSEFGVILAGQKQADGTIQSLEIYRAKGAGFPLGFSEKAWAEWSVTLNKNNPDGE